MLFIVNFILILNTAESVAKKNYTSIYNMTGKLRNDKAIDVLICPKEPLKIPFFSTKCKMNEDCIVSGEICCRDKNISICRRGIQKRKSEMLDFSRKTSQSRIQTICPSRESVFEILPIRNCTTNSDCGLWRICCPDGDFSYCRRGIPKIDLIFSVEIVKTFNNVMSYVQCTPPPPPPLDFFAKPCKTMLDCFPNLCCQEQGRKVCRPSKRSIFPLLTISGSYKEQLKNRNKIKQKRRTIKNN